MFQPVCVLTLLLYVLRDLEVVIHVMLFAKYQNAAVMLPQSVLYNEGLQNFTPSDLPSVIDLSYIYHLLPSCYGDLFWIFLAQQRFYSRLHSIHGIPCPCDTGSKI